MSTKMKGLLKGLRYISQIFDANGKEHEMQIGYPTDVKHVAHIGWDGPSVSSPSWAQMNEFRSAPLSSLGNEAMESSTTSRPSQGLVVSSPVRNLPEHPLPKPGSRRQELIASSASSPSTGSPRRGHHPRSDGASTRELLLALDAVAGGGGGSGGGSPASPNRPRHSRRHQSTGGVSVDSPTRDSPSGSAAPGKTRHHRKAAAAAGGDSPSQDTPLIPKQSRKKKTKASSGGSGSSRSSSRSKASAAAAAASESVPESRSDHFTALRAVKEEEEGI